MRRGLLLLFVIALLAFTVRTAYATDFTFTDSYAVHYTNINFWLYGQNFVVFSPAYAGNVTVYLLYENSTFASFTKYVSPGTTTLEVDDSFVRGQYNFYVYEGSIDDFKGYFIPAYGYSYVIVLTTNSIVMTFKDNYTTFMQPVTLTAPDSTMSITIIPSQTQMSAMITYSNTLTLYESYLITHRQYKDAQQIIFLSLENNSTNLYEQYIVQHGNDAPGYAGFTWYEVYYKNGTPSVVFMTDTLVTGQTDPIYTYYIVVTSNSIIMTLIQVSRTITTATFTFSSRITSFYIVYQLAHELQTALGGATWKDPDWIVDEESLWLVENSQTLVQFTLGGGNNSNYPFRGIILVTVPVYTDFIETFLNQQTWFPATGWKKAETMISNGGDITTFFKNSGIAAIVFLIMDVLMAFAAYAYARNVSFALAVFFVFTLITSLFTTDFMTTLSAYQKLVMYVVGFFTLLFTVFFVNFFRNRGGEA